MASIRPKNEKSMSKHRWLWWLGPISGFICLVWFLIRVIPKPSRASYPCQRAAFPIASGFVVWLLGLGGSTLIFRRAKKHLSSARYFSGLLCVAASIGCIWVCLALNADKQLKAAGSTPANSPIGIARGVHPGRVVWVHEPNATTWNGPGTGDGYWWQSNHTNQQVVNSMVQQAICALAGQADISNAWDAIIRNFNQTHDKGNIGYTSGEKFMIKVNFVDMIAVRGGAGATDYNFVSVNHHPDYPICSPQIMHTLLDQLVNVVGVSQSDITIGDPTCLWCNEFYDMIQPDFPNVHYLDYLGWYNRTQATLSGVRFYWSTTHANGKTPDYVMQSYVDAEYFINLPTLKSHHNVAGITVCGKNHYGSIRRPDESGYYDMHSDAPYTVSASGNYRPMVDLMGHSDMGGKTMLCLVDGLYAGQHGKNPPGFDHPVPLRWQMPPFNNDWPSSIFVSQDQVATDSVGFDFLVNEWPDATGPAHEGTDDYLHEAAQADNPASGTFYDPEGDGTRLSSLGVHEHWNNPTDKQYTRNLGTGDGIELVKVSLTPNVDYNDDGKVNFEDFAVFAQYWHQAGSLADIAPQPVPDGVVDYKDLFVFCQNWLAATRIPPLPAQAASPSPADNASGVSTDANLSWSAGAGAESHDVYFGTVDPPPFIVNQTASIFDPGTLDQSKTYYWQIDEINGWGSTAGSIWQFSTSAPGLSDTTDDMSGTVSAFGDNSASGEGAAQAFDNNTATKWLDFKMKDIGYSWIQYQYASGKTSVVTEYTITSANDSPERDPKSWNILGSNNGGASWDTLDTRTGELFTTRFEKRTFWFTNSTGYNIYRLDITAVRDIGAANSVQLAEIELIGTSPQ
jgi:hypothetical protein